MENRYRHLPLEGLYNARDLGGYAVSGGKVTKFGRFIRADGTSRLTGSDLAFLREYGVTRSIDFRGEQEVQHSPSRLAGLDWLSYHNIPVFNAQVAGTNLLEAFGPGFEWGPLYIQMLEDHKDWAAACLSLAAESTGAVLYNCTAGKDRTGLFTMLLLGIAGVSDPDIVADYTVSQIYLRPLFEMLFRSHGGGPVDYSHPTFDTSPKNMEVLLAHIGAAYGSVPGYARACGVSETVLEKIREKLL